MLFRLLARWSLRRLEGTLGIANHTGDTATRLTRIGYAIDDGFVKLCDDIRFLLLEMPVAAGNGIVRDRPTPQSTPDFPQSIRDFLEQDLEKISDHRVAPNALRELQQTMLITQYDAIVADRIAEHAGLHCRTEILEAALAKLLALREKQPRIVPVTPVP